MDITAMKSIFLSFIALAILTNCSNENIKHADFIFSGSDIYTANESQDVVDTIAISKDKIIFVGEKKDSEKFKNELTREIKLDGKMILPGLHDVHIHLPGIVDSEFCDLNVIPYSLDELVPILKKCIKDAELEDGEWLSVTQWQYYSGNAPSGENPSLRVALDNVSANHPIMLLGHDGHTSGVNSYALDLATDSSGNQIGLNRETVLNEFSYLNRLIGVNENGDPTGLVKEHARKIFKGHPNLWGNAEITEKVYKDSARILAESGITSVLDAALRDYEIVKFADFASIIDLTYRLHIAFYSDYDEFRTISSNEINIDQIITTIKDLQENYNDIPNFHLTTGKIFVDGVLEGDPLSTPPMLPNAASLSDYLQPVFYQKEGIDLVQIERYIDPRAPECKKYFDLDTDNFIKLHKFHPNQCIESKGVFEHDLEFIENYTAALHGAGINVHSHTIGDRAFRAAIDAFESAKKMHPTSQGNFSVSHAQVIHPDDKPRLSDIEIFFAFTYSWIEPFSDYLMTVSPFFDRIFSEEDLYHQKNYYYKNSYPVKSVQDAGGILVAGSDAPVETRDPRPFYNLEKSITRKNNDTGRVMNSLEAISLFDAIDAYTINGAKMLQHDQMTGSLEVGKKADFIIIDKNLLELDSRDMLNEISETKVLSTWFDGKEIYSRSNDQNDN